MKRYLMLAACAAMFSGCGQKDAASLNIGQNAPAFAAQRLGGGAVNFPADMAGKAVAIRFWADWCHYCEGEMKDIEPIYRRYQALGAEVLAVNAGQDSGTVAAFAKKIAASYPVLLDEKAGVARQYGVVGLPTTYFVDAKGVIRAKVVGETDAATFEKHLRTAVEAKP